MGADHQSTGVIVMPMSGCAPSIFSKGNGIICCRKSGEQSIKSMLPSISIRMEALRRLSRGSVEEHTAQLHPIWGTPVDVPVPKNCTFIICQFVKKLPHFLQRAALLSFEMRCTILILSFQNPKIVERHTICSSQVIGITSCVIFIDNLPSLCYSLLSIVIACHNNSVYSRSFWARITGYPSLTIHLSVTLFSLTLKEAITTLYLSIQLHVT